MVRIDAKEEHSGDIPHFLTVFLENNFIRGIGGVGIGQYLLMEE